MHFIDEAKIYCKAGDGGQGSMSFRRDKFVEFGGPDGGNGGNGGNVILRSVENLNTLLDFRYNQHFKASKGQHGKGKNRTGASGEDLIIEVPVGTQVFSEDNNYLIADFTEPNQEYLLLQGGDGGKGNAHFKTSVNKAPKRSTPGYPGGEMWIWLKLKLLSDVGLVGLPNAGKSTFLSVVSAAKPKIADYPFTTLSPNLGMVEWHHQSFCIADIPGLIEGASQGHGLGHKFLKHIERCKTLIHLIDITSSDIEHDIDIINQEMSNFAAILLEKPTIYVLNKSDLLPPEQAQEIQKHLAKRYKAHFFLCSAATKSNLKPILEKAWQLIHGDQVGF